MMGQLYRFWFRSGGARRALAVLLTWLAVPAAHAQQPAWLTATALNQASGANTSVVTATAADASGNVYLAGSFTGTVSFGSISLTSQGNLDVFVAKRTAAGTFAWAQRAGGAGNDIATAVALNGASVYVAGAFESATAGFGSAVLANPSPGLNDAFVTKLTDAGSTSSFVWAQRAGGPRIDVATSIGVSGASVYVAGSFASATAGFGGITLTNLDDNTTDAFVAKLTDAGATASFAWAQRAGGPGDDQLQALSVTGASLYVVGNFNGATAGFGSTTLTNADNATTIRTTDVFVAKLTDAGATASFAWAHRAGGATYDYTSAVAVSGTSVYVTGYLSGSAVGFGGTALASAGGFDGFVAKLTDAGSSSSFAWAQRAGGAAFDGIRAVAVSGASVYVAGSFASATAGFGATTLANAHAGSGTSADVFVAKLTDGGSAASFSWAQSAGGLAEDVANTVAVVGTSVVVGGFVTPAASFGTQVVAAPAGSQVGFVASLPSAPPAATAPAQLAGLSVYPNPARARTAVHLPAGTAPATLTLRDALGRVVRTHAGVAAGTVAEVPLTGLAPGIYQLHVETGHQRATRWLAVE